MLNINNAINMSIRTKLLISLSFMVALTIIIGVTSFIQIKSIQSAAAETAKSFEIAESSASLSIAISRFDDAASQYALNNSREAEELRHLYAMEDENLSEVHASHIALITDSETLEDALTYLDADGFDVTLMEFHDAANKVVLAREELLIAEQNFTNSLRPVEVARSKIQNTFRDQGFTDIELVYRTTIQHEKQMLFESRNTQARMVLENDISKLRTAIQASEMNEGTKQAAFNALSEYSSLVDQLSNIVLTDIAVKQDALVNAMNVADETRVGMLVLGEQEMAERAVLVAENIARQDDAVTNAVVVIAGVTASAVVIAVALSLILSRAISKPITLISRAASKLSEEDLPKLAQGIKAVSEGDLTCPVQMNLTMVDVSSKDELGMMAGAFNGVNKALEGVGSAYENMVSRLKTLISQMGNTADVLATTSSQLSNTAQRAGRYTEEISGSSLSVAERSQEQSESVAQTASAIQELSRSIDQISQGSQHQAQSITNATTIVSQVSNAIAQVAQFAQDAGMDSRQTTDAAMSGMKMVNSTIEGMNKIRAKVDIASSQVTDLGRKSAEIGKIVAVIDDIADQTNLLALNAAIEAARAGDQGRGFAVVADEVRSLAERVTRATKEIEALINNVQQGVDESVKAIEDGTAEVAAGVRLAEEAGGALSKILESVESVNKQIEQISAAAEEVNASSIEMVSTIDGVSVIVEGNSAAAQQMAASSNEVAESIENITTTAEQNSSVTQQVYASIGELNSQVQEVAGSSQLLERTAQDLQQVVSTFNIDDSESEEVPEYQPL